jgi:hypothetical protein
MYLYTVLWHFLDEVMILLLLMTGYLYCRGRYTHHFDAAVYLFIFQYTQEPHRTFK